jgi:hypothetical protein
MIAAMFEAQVGHGHQLASPDSVGQRRPIHALYFSRSQAIKPRTMRLSFSGGALPLRNHLELIALKLEEPYLVCAHPTDIPWFAFAIPCHRVLHTGATHGRRREGRQYDWVDYEAKLAAKRR